MQVVTYQSETTKVYSSSHCVLSLLPVPFAGNITKARHSAHSPPVRKNDGLTSTKTICVLTLVMTVNPDSESAGRYDCFDFTWYSPIRSSLKRCVDLISQRLPRRDGALCCLHCSIEPGRTVEELSMSMECSPDPSVQTVGGVNENDISLMRNDRRWTV